MPKIALMFKDAEISAMHSRGVKMQDIASYYGVSRVAVWARCKAMGLESRRKPIESRVCAVCGKSYNRQAFRRSSVDYCSQRCYLKDRTAHSIQHKPRGSVSHRSWQRQARKIVGARKGQVVHHIDGDSSNNSISNLLVFNSHADHLKHHHGLRIN